MTHTNMKQELDVRYLLPPEPFQQVMEALFVLPDKAALQVHIHREPFPLYEVLRANNYVWKTTAQPDGCFSIHISRSP